MNAPGWTNVSGAGVAVAAPNVTAGAATVEYGLYDNASAFGFAGTVTLPTSDPAYGWLAKVHVMWVRGGNATEVAVLNGPFASGSANWDSGAYLTFLQDGAAHTDSIEFQCENLYGLLTASPLTLSVTVEAAAVTSITSASEVGPQVITQDNQASRLVSTTISFVPVLGSNQVPQNVSFLVSEDNGANYVYTGWSLVSTVGQAVTVSKDSPIAAANWKVAACIGAVGGDPTIAIPAASLAAAFPGVQISASFSVAGLSLPAATAVTGASVGSFSNIIRNDGTQYGEIGPCTYTDPTDLSFFVRVTVQQYNAAGVSIAAEQPFSGFDVAGAGGTVRTTGVLDIAYVAGLASIWYRIYLSSRASSGEYDFLNPALAVLQSCWAGSATHAAVAITLPTSWGAGLTTDATTGLPKVNAGPGTTTTSAGQLAATVASESLLLDYGFELTPAGVMTSTTVSPWILYSGSVTIENDGTAYSGLQYARLGASALIYQFVPARPGESLYVAVYVRTSGASASWGLTIYWYPASGPAIASVVPVTATGLLSGWTLFEGTAVVPAGAQQAQVCLDTGTVGTVDFDSIRVDPVRRAGNLALSGALGNDGSGNTTVFAGAGLKTVGTQLLAALGAAMALDGSNNMTVNVGGGVKIASNTIQVNLGNGVTTSAGALIVNLGNGLTMSSGAVVANVGGGLSASTGVINLNLGNGVTLNSGALVANLGSALSATGGAINLQLGDGVTIQSGLLIANLGGGMKASSGAITLNTGQGITVTGSVVETNVGGGITYSGVQIVIASGGVGPTQIASVDASQINTGTITVGSGGMTFSGSGGILIAGGGTFAQLVGAASSQSFTATGLSGVGVRAFYLSSVNSTVIDTDANANFATLSIQGSVRIDASGNVTTNNCNVYGALNFQGSLASSATAGSATLPSAPVGFVYIQVGGTAYKMAYYAT